MGAPETEIVVTGTVKSVDGDRASIDTVAAQGENQTIRNAEAEVRCSVREGAGHPSQLVGCRRGWQCRRRAPDPPHGTTSASCEMLSPRQELILRLVVDAYLASARPVGRRRSPRSRRSSGGRRRCAPSWLRSRRPGISTHPHTSAGRVPTDSGYRSTSTLLLGSGAPPAAPRSSCELSRLRREVDEAMRETTAALAQVTDLVALATAPPASARGDDPPGRGPAPAARPG